ncbi:MAG TPA: glycine zipper 2TM domain-containing protein [Xanthomonadales bacterium]|nr:glycine zipper 2TM domain-containing protein [Xanthomonadales bacterium]
MNRFMLAALALALAMPAVAQRYGSGPRGASSENVNFAYADVLRVDPVYEYVQSNEPREECYDERVVTREQGRDSAGGAVLGAIVGAAIGNQVGSGDGRRAATAAGAVIGGTVGANAARNNGGTRAYESTQRRCRLVDDYREDQQVVGYDVEYRYRGDVYVSRLGYDPGDRLRVRVSVTPAD